MKKSIDMCIGIERQRKMDDLFEKKMTHIAKGKPGKGGGCSQGARV